MAYKMLHFFPSFPLFSFDQLFEACALDLQSLEEFWAAFSSFGRVLGSFL
jgi:hypothetical protein